MTNRGRPAPELELVVPVFNEERVLAASVRRLHSYLSHNLECSWRITIADNASTDGTPAIAQQLADELTGVRRVRLEAKGRGNALRQVWLASDAEVVAYVDVDLSTDLAALPPLVAPLFSGHSDIAIGTRLSRSSRVIRGGRRDFISRSYNALLHGAMSVSFTDAQCGFKAVRRDVARRLLPLVEDGAWFFDTELLILAERAGLRIHEVPVDWTDDPDSRVNVLRTAIDDLRGLARLTTALARRRIPIEAVYEDLGRGPLQAETAPTFASQAIRFAVIGGFSTLAYALLYLVIQPFLGPQPANFSALLLTAVANTGLNRWFTFGVTGRRRVVRHHVMGLMVFGLAWGITASALWALHQHEPDAGAVTEILVLTVANLVGTVLRFLLLRGWVFRVRRVAPAETPGSRRRARAGDLRTTGTTTPDPSAASTDTASTDPTSTERTVLT